MNDIEQRCINLMKEAWRRQASDIHFHPKEAYISVQFRIDGRLVPYAKLKRAIYERMLSYFKFQAKMDIGEKRRPQNGAMTLSIDGQKLSVRLSTIPTPYQESLALRLLPLNQHVSLDKLFLFRESANRLSALINSPAGFAILTGPTGSGKTTTIYACLLEAVHKHRRRVITIEDPIEKTNDAFTQLEVNEKAGITFEEGFKASLRHDPDIIMIGEIRDQMTAQIAVRAALTGHFIVTSMHAKNPLGALYRLLEFGIPLTDIQQTVVAVASQRLVPVLCPVCGPERGESGSDHFKTNRKAIIELLADDTLEQTLEHIGSKTSPMPDYPTLKDELEKGIQLGYVHSEYEQEEIGFV